MNIFFKSADSHVIFPFKRINGVVAAGNSIAGKVECSLQEAESILNMKLVTVALGDIENREKSVLAVASIERATIEDGILLVDLSVVKVA